MRTYSILSIVNIYPHVYLNAELFLEQMQIALSDNLRLTLFTYPHISEQSWLMRGCGIKDRIIR